MKNFRNHRIMRRIPVGGVHGVVKCINHAEDKIHVAYGDGQSIKLNKPRSVRKIGQKVLVVAKAI